MKRLLATALVILALAACAPPVDPVDPCDHEVENHAQGMIDCPDISQHGHMQEAEVEEADEHGEEHGDDHDG